MVGQRYDGEGKEAGSGGMQGERRAMGGGGGGHGAKKGGSRGRRTGAGAVSRGLSILAGRPAGAQRGETCCTTIGTTWGRSTWIRQGRGWQSSAGVGVVVCPTQIKVFRNNRFEEEWRLFT